MKIDGLHWFRWGVCPNYQGHPSMFNPFSAEMDTPMAVSKPMGFLPFTRETHPHLHSLDRWPRPTAQSDGYPTNADSPSAPFCSFFLFLFFRVQAPKTPKHMYVNRPLLHNPSSNNAKNTKVLKSREVLPKLLQGPATKMLQRSRKPDKNTRAHLYNKKGNQLSDRNQNGSRSECGCVFWRVNSLLDCFVQGHQQENHCFRLSPQNEWKFETFAC